MATPASTCLQTGAKSRMTTVGASSDEMLDPSEGIGGAEDLADLSRELCASVWSPDDNDEIVARATAEARLSLAATAVAGEKPTWWAALQEAVLGGYDPDASLG